MSIVEYSWTLSLEVQTCISCGCTFGIPSTLDKKLRKNRNVFYCPNGHSQHYTGETEAQKLQRELKRKEQELADAVQQKLLLQQQATKAERKLKRLNNGICSCCNRSFQNLAEHVKNEHPELIGQEKPKRKYTKK